MMLRGIEMLEADPETQVIVLVGKVPSKTVLNTLIQKTSGSQETGSGLFERTNPTLGRCWSVLCANHGYCWSDRDRAGR